MLSHIIFDHFTASNCVEFHKRAFVDRLKLLDNTEITADLNRILQALIRYYGK